MSFAFETTLSTRSFKNIIKEAKQKDYTVTLLFFWLQSIEMAKERVRTRVKEGGHNIETNIIERRYIRGIKNLFNIYLPIVDGAFIFDNSKGNHKLLAQKMINEQLIILKENQFKKLKNTMTTVEKQTEMRDKILVGLEKAYEKLIEFKKQKNSELVVMRDNKIVRIKPE